MIELERRTGSCEAEGRRKVAGDPSKRSQSAGVRASSSPGAVSGGHLGAGWSHSIEAVVTTKETFSQLNFFFCT